MDTEPAPKFEITPFSNVWEGMEPAPKMEVVTITFEGLEDHLFGKGSVFLKK